MLSKIVFLRKRKKEEGQGKEGMKNYSVPVSEQMI